MDRVQRLLKDNWKYILVIVVLVVVVFAFSTSESFSDLAEYPKIFSESVAKPFVTTVFDAQPVMPAISQLSVESQIQTVMIDIGNGTAVEAPVHIPAQIVDRVDEQRIIKYIEPKDTDVIVASQVIQLPEQEGVIKSEVNGDGDYVKIPVSVPAQTVVVPEQNAKETTMEKFHI
jgi:hypothetical protein